MILMKITSRGWVALLVITGLVLSVAVAGGFVLADEQPSGEAILTEVESSYQNANSTVVDATVVTERGDNVTTFDVHTVATKSGQMRVNVSNDSGYLVGGTNGNETWIAGTELAAPLVIRNDGVKNHTSFDVDTLNAIEGNISAYSTGNESNFTHMFGNETMRNESGASSLNPDVMPVTDYDAILSNHAGSESYNETAIAKFDPGNWSVSKALEETNVTAERVKTVTEDGQEMHVVVISAPEEDEELKLWVSAQDATVEKEELTTPNGTVTVEMDTRFNVSLTASTFEPPSPIVDEQSVDSISELRKQSANSLAVPSDNWTFLQGSVLERPVSLTAAQYSNETRNVTVVQSEGTVLSGLSEEGSRVNISDQTVRISNLSSMESGMGWYGMDEGVIGQWTEDDQAIVVAGNLSESQLVDIIESIEFERSDS
jgi:outer membrane lipoprotein-sorting protein